MESYDIVLVILVYRNIDVLRDFFKSINLDFTYKIIVVNSFYDEASERECRIVADENDAVFISVPNNGYGAGNNKGCDYALRHYGFRYLILSNSDIIINDLSYLKKINKTIAVIASDTKMLNNHRQNPNIPFCSKVYMWLLKLAYNTDIRSLKKMALGLNRFYRELMQMYIRISRNKFVRIFSPHGSFIIFTHEAVKILEPIFNEDMFLYNEEIFLGYKCKMMNIPVYYAPMIRITHLEGASSTESDNSWENKKASHNVLMEWKKDNGL